MMMLTARSTPYTMLYSVWIILKSVRKPFKVLESHVAFYLSEGCYSVTASADMYQEDVRYQIQGTNTYEYHMTGQNSAVWLIL